MASGLALIGAHAQAQQLAFRDSVLDDLLDGARSLATAEIGGSHYVFVTGENDDGLSAFAFDGSALTLVAQVKDNGVLAIDSPRSVSVAGIAGTTYLFVTGFIDDGVSVFTFDGRALTPVTTVTDTASLQLDGAVASTTAVIGGITYLFVAGFMDDGVSVFSFDGNVLTPVTHVTDGGSLELDGARSVAIADIAGVTYLFVAGFVDNGVSAFSFDGSTLTPVADIADDATLKLAGTRNLASLALGGTTYLIVTGYSDDAVTAFAFDGNAFTWVAEVVDTAGLELDGADAISISVDGGTAHILVTGSIDDGASAFSFNGAAFTHVANILDNGAIELDAPVAATSLIVDHTLYFVVAGFDDDGLTVISYESGVLTPVASVDDASLELDGARRSTTAVVDGETYLFTAGRLDDGVSVFAVADDGTITNVFNVTDDISLRLDDVVNLTTMEVAGTTYLFTAATVDDGISVFRVDAGGALVNVYNLGDGGSLTLDENQTLATAQIGALSFLFAGGPWEGISVFRVNTNGSLIYTQSVSDGSNAAHAFMGLVDLATVEVAGTTYLFATGTNEHGLSVFSVAGSGQLTHIGAYRDAGALELSGAYGLATAVVEETTYLFVTGADDDGVSVFSVAPGGALTNVFNVTDNADMRLDGAISVDTLEVGGTTYLFVAGSENGFSLFSVAPDGALTHLQSIADTNNTYLTGLGTVSAAIVNNTPLAFITAYTDDAVSSFELSPPPSLEIAGPAGPVAGAFTATFTFSESVTGFALDEITVGNGAASNFAGSGTTYTATITPATEGAVTVDIAAGVAQNASGYGNTAAAQYTVTADLAPSVEITGPTPAVNGAFTATFTFSENVTGFDIGGIVLHNASSSDFSGSGASYTATITPGSEGLVLIGVNVDSAVDAGGNGNTAAIIYSVLADWTAPGLTISGPGGPVNGAFTAGFTFTEGVSGFELGDILVTNGTASNFSGSNSSYSATITPDGEGMVTVGVVPDAAMDVAGNASTAASSLTLTADLTAPGLVISGPTGPVSGAFTATFTFSEDVTGFILDGFVVGNGAASDLAGSGTTYTATITPAGDGSVTVDVAQGVAADAAGNGNTVAIQFSVTADVTAPRVSSISRQSPGSSPTNSDNMTWRVAFDEAVSFTGAQEASTFALTNVANVTNGSPVAIGGASYATTAVLNGTTYLFVAETVRDAISVFSVATNGSLTLVFSVTDNATLQLNGASSIATAEVNGTTYLFVGGSDDDGVSVFSVGGSDDDGVSVFSVGNDGRLTDVFNVTDDATLELGGVASVATAVVNRTTYLFVAGYADDGISVFVVANDGSLSNVFNVMDAGSLELLGPFSVSTAVVNDATYLFVASLHDDGVSVFSVANDGSLTNVFNVTDSGLLELDGARSVTTAVVDDTTYLFVAGRIDDGVSVFSVANDGSLTNVFNVTDDATLELDEAVSVTTTVINGITYLFVAASRDDGVSVFSVASNGSLTNVFNVTDGGLLELDGVFAVTAAVVDGTTYLFTPAFVDNGISVFSVHPPLAAVENFTLSGTSASLSEVVVSPTIVDVTASGGDLAALNGTVTLGFASGQTFADLAGNALADVTPTGTNDNSYGIDNSAPGVAISGPAGPIAGAFTATFTFTEDVTGFSAADIAAGNAAVANFSSVLASQYTATITPSGDGVVTLDVAEARAADFAGNANTAATQFSVNADLTVPSLVISGPAGPVSGAFTATFTFSESVSGFALGDISVGNGSGSNLAGSGAIYTATITPAGDGSVTVDVAQGVAADAAGNGSTASNEFSVDADLTAPTLVISGPVGPVSGAFSATFTFSESVSGFALGDIAVGNGSGSNLAGSGAIYSATITPASEGDVTVDVAANAASDAAGNTSTAASRFSITNDATAPRLEITGPVGPVSGAFTATFTFSEDVTGFALGDIAVGNGSASNLSGSGADYTATITPSADDEVTVDVAADAASDAAGNTSTAASQFSVTNDATAPTLTITGPAGPVAGAFTTSFTFSEDVTGFTLSGISVGNGTASDLAGSGAVYTATITPSADGEVTVDVAADAASDAAGNTSTAASRFSVTNDATAPTLTITGPVGPVSGAFTATFTFSEDVTGFELSDIAVTNGSAADLSGSGSVYTATITPAADGYVRVDVDAGVSQDEAGNGNSVADQFSVENDQSGPTITLVSPDGGSVIAAFPVQVTFSESVVGFDAADIVVGNGSASTVSGSGQSYALTVTPAGDGDVTIDIADGAAQDAAGNASIAASRLTVSADLTDPVLTITGPVGPVNDSFAVTFTFSEAVIGFTVDDIAVTNGVASNFQGNSPSEYTAVIALSATGTVEVSVADRAASDLFGRVNAAASFSVEADIGRPSVVVSGPAGPLNTAFTATFTFSEDVTGFEAGDVIVANGSASGFTAMSASVYTVTITPASDGDVVVLSHNAAAIDIAGNASTASNEYSVAFDATAPTLVITGPSGPVSGAFTATYTFSEDVTGFAPAGITVGNGTVSNFASVLASQYTATITPASDGLVTLDVAAEAASDAAGNASTAASRFSVTNDQTAPRIASIARQSPATELTDADSLTWRVTFDEAVTGVDTGDFAVSGTTALVTGVTNSAGNAFDVTVSGGNLASLNGTVTLTALTTGDIADEAGNRFAVSVPTGTNDNRYTVLNDREAPVLLAVVRQAPPVQLTNADVLVWRVSFSEAVVGVDPSDFAVSGTTASVTSLSGVPVSFPPSVTGEAGVPVLAIAANAYDVTVSGGNLAAFDGDIALSVSAGNDISDAAGNALAGTAPTGSNQIYTLDNTAPTVAITSTVVAPVAGPFGVTITFSEDVTGFDVSDLTAGNATASGFVMTDARTYAATLTPGAGSPVTLDIAAGAAKDAAGNDNAAPGSFSIEHQTGRSLGISLAGVGSGTVTSDPDGIDCGQACLANFTVGASVTLTAAAAEGSNFAGWMEGPCAGSADATCLVSMTGNQSVVARFRLNTPPAGRIVAATLPAARSGYVGGPSITVFLSVVSRTTSPAQSCTIAAADDAPFSLTYRRVDANNAAIGEDDPLFDIPNGGTLSFVLAMAPTAQTPAQGYEFMPVITCENASLDPIVGVNNVFLTIEPAPAPDILSISATPSGDGVIRILTPGGVRFMTAAAVNIGAGDGSAGDGEVTMTTTVDTGRTVLPVSLELCRINESAQCITPRGSSVTTNLPPNTPQFFAVFVRDTSGGAGIPFDPANARVFLRFADATGMIRSATSAAVTAPAAADIPVASALPSGRWSVLMRRDDGGWPGLVRTSLHVADNGVTIVDDGIQPRLAAFDPAIDPGVPGRFQQAGLTGRWTSDGLIRLGAAWADTPGEFWGVRDARNEGGVQWRDLAGDYGGSIHIEQSGEIRGMVGGCAVYGQASGAATSVTALSLTGCAMSGSYASVIDLPVNDNESPVLVIAGQSAGWRLAQ